jgi:Flp pilus assembly protein TadD
MRLSLLVFLLLAACAGGADPKSGRTPGLDVADVALVNGSPDTALRIARQTLATDPRNVPALLRVAEAQAALGQPDQAAGSYGRALAISPDDPGAALGLGRLLLANDPAGSVRVLLRLTERDPRNVAALVDLGIARDLLGKHAEAQTAYRQALALEPRRVAAQVNLGLSLALSGDPRQALAILRPIADGSDASPRVRQDLAVALVLAGDDAGAATVLRADIPQSSVLTVVASYRALRVAP